MINSTKGDIERLQSESRELKAEDSELKSQLRILSKMNMELEDEIELAEQKLQKEKQAYQRSIGSSQSENGRKSGLGSQVFNMENTSRRSQPAVLQKTRQIISVQRVEPDNKCCYLLVMATVLLGLATLLKLLL